METDRKELGGRRKKKFLLLSLSRYDCRKLIFGKDIEEGGEKEVDEPSRNEMSTKKIGRKKGKGLFPVFFLPYIFCEKSVERCGRGVCGGDLIIKEEERARDVGT